MERNNIVCCIDSLLRDLDRGVTDRQGGIEAQLASMAYIDLTGSVNGAEYTPYIVRHDGTFRFENYFPWSLRVRI